MSLFKRKNILIAFVFCLPILSIAQIIPDTIQFSTKSDSIGTPVVVNFDTLFFVTARVLSFSPEDRARVIRDKIARITADHSIDPDSISVQSTETGEEISIDDLIIMTVTPTDARMAQTDPKILARQILSRIQSHIIDVRSQKTIEKYIIAAVYSILTLIALIIVLWGIQKLFGYFYLKIKGWQGGKIRTLKIQKLEILSAEKATQGLITLARLFRFIITLVILYAALSMIFGFFPQTRHFSSYLASHLWGLVQPMVMAIVHYLPNFVITIILIALAYYSIKAVRFFFNSVRAGYIRIPGFYNEWIDTTYKVVRLGVIILYAVLIFPYLPGSDSTAFKGISIFIGLLFSLGSTSIIANMVAGLILTYMRPFKLDDRVKIADTIGDVVEKTMLVTRIRTIKNELITVPNSMVLSSHIINYSSSVTSKPLILHTSVTIGYDTPWRQVHELLVSAAAATEHILSDPGPFVLQLSLDDFNVRYELNAYTDSPRDMAKVYSDLHQNIQDQFNKAGVEIMSPNYESIRDGGNMAIPSEYQSKISNPFRVRLEKENSE